MLKNNMPGAVTPIRSGGNEAVFGSGITDERFEELVKQIEELKDLVKSLAEK